MSLITLTTDFGASSPYVGAMRGVILSINPHAQLVDVSHSVPPQDIRHGALVLAETTPLFPLRTLHVAVVDPGVGTARAVVYAEIAGQRYLCPDNGLLSRLAISAKPTKMRAVTNPLWFRRPTSTTFHGRDIMAPVAAHLSLGVDPAELGPPLEQLIALDWPGVAVSSNRVEGQVTAIDSFGNLITNISRAMLAEAPADDRVGVTCDEHETRGIFATYGDQPPMTLIALFGSNDMLELAIVGDSAAIMLGVKPGAAVEVTW